MATSTVIKVKPEFRKTKIAFGKSGEPLGERDDLADLLIAVYRARHQRIIDMFDNPPSLEELEGKDVDKALAAIQPAQSSEAAPTNTTPAKTENKTITPATVANEQQKEQK